MTSASSAETDEAFFLLRNEAMKFFVS